MAKSRTPSSKKPVSSATITSRIRGAVPAPRKHVARGTGNQIAMREPTAPVVVPMALQPTKPTRTVVASAAGFAETERVVQAPSLAPMQWRWLTAIAFLSFVMSGFTLFCFSKVSASLLPPLTTTSLTAIAFLCGSIVTSISLTLALQPQVRTVGSIRLLLPAIVALLLLSVALQVATTSFAEHGLATLPAVTSWWSVGIAMLALVATALSFAAARLHKHLLWLCAGLAHGALLANNAAFLPLTVVTMGLALHALWKRDRSTTWALLGFAVAFPLVAWLGTSAALRLDVHFPSHISLVAWSPLVLALAVFGGVRFWRDNAWTGIALLALLAPSLIAPTLAANQWVLIVVVATCGTKGIFETAGVAPTRATQWALGIALTLLTTGTHPALWAWA